MPVGGAGDAGPSIFGPNGPQYFSGVPNSVFRAASFRGIVPDYANIKLPVGLGGVSVQSSFVKVSDSRSGQTTIKTGLAAPPSIDRRDTETAGPNIQPSVTPAVVSQQSGAAGAVVKVTDKKQFDLLIAAGIKAVLIAKPGAAIVNTGGDSMPLDLGQILGGLGSEYINARYGQQATPQVIYANSPTIPVGMGDPGGGIPFVDVIPEPPAGCSPRDYVYKFTCDGWRWIKRRKRRRKQLVTKGDIAGLASLKGVTTGEQMKTWIATHS